MNESKDTWYSPRQTLRKISKKLLAKINSVSEAQEVIKASELRVRILSEWYCNYSDVPPRYAFIAFSRDRPLQLHALLSSLRRFVPARPKTIVLFYASKPAFFAGYKKCFDLFSDEKNITFTLQTRQDSFQQDLLNILVGLDESRTVFLVDDIIFIREIALQDFDGLDLRTDIPSLRLGRNIQYSYALNKRILLPRSLTEQDSGLLSWNWRDGDVEWAYPLSVDGHIFLRTEILSMLRRLQFSSPNTFESALQSLTDLYLNRRGVCYKLPRLVNIPFNRVQNDFPNRHGSITAMDLLEKWQEGLGIDISRLENFYAESVHVEPEIRFNRLER